MVNKLYPLFKILSNWIDSKGFWRFAGFGAGFLCLLKKGAPQYQVMRGFSAEQLEKFEKAAEAYGIAADIAGKSASMAALRWQHPAQFFMYRMNHRLGRPGESDPLFTCEIETSSDSNHADGEYAGSYKAEFAFSGLMIIGMVPGGAGKTVEVMIGGKLLREFRIGKGTPYPRFNIKVLRSTLKHFPQKAELSLRIKDGGPLALFGKKNRNSRCFLTVPHGTGGIIETSETGIKLNKKGDIVPSRDEIEQRKTDYMELYDEIRDLFDQKLGKQLFLMYGTLLGSYRQDDLIDGDDDFDAGYISEETDPVNVKKETMEMIFKLIEEGYTISFNRRGRLFRLHAKDDSERGYVHNLHLDVRPIWFQDGKVWAHNHFCMEAGRSDFLPVIERKLRGKKTYIPSETEKFLMFQYGPGWKVPDPGFVYHRSEIPKEVFDNLEVALITPSEYQELYARIEERKKADSGIGKLLSIGAESFYPLTGLEEDLE